MSSDTEVEMRIYETMDRDGGGSVSNKELSKFISKTFNRELSEQQIGDMMGEVSADDQNNIALGVFSDASFCKLMGPQLKLPLDEQVKLAFAALDYNGTGKITIEDMVPIMQALQGGRGRAKHTKEVLEKMCKSGSKDGTSILLADLARVYHQVDPTHI